LFIILSVFHAFQKIFLLYLKKRIFIEKKCKFWILIILQAQEFANGISGKERNAPSVPAVRSDDPEQ
jgi:hypothetical protein